MKRCYAALRFFGPTLDHRTITALLGRDPSYAHLPGERRNRVGTPHPNGMWLLSSETQVASTDLQDHSGWLLDQIEEKASLLLPYLLQTGAEKDIDCYQEKDGNAGTCFAPALLKRLTALDLGLGITVYYVDDSEEDLQG